ncbi:MAG: extracellular solute-binding protein, partial [bacterium]|nr:extracellular solute-binding protein [bacterium]
MTRDELLRILDFSDMTRALAEKRTSLAQADARWNIISYSMRRHLEGKLLTITSAAAASGAPYGTAMRRIGELIDSGLLLKRPRSKSGKSFSLHPTRKLIREFESYALQLKAHVGDTFGFIQDESGMEDFFFGASYMAPKILSFPNAMRTGIGYDRTVRMLCPADPTFRTLAKQNRTINELCGSTIDVICLPNEDLHRAILDNHEQSESQYDLVCFDLPWIGELSKKGVIRPLNEIIEAARYNSSDFHTAAWKGSRYDKKQLGVPIQPTAELLFYRADLFAKAGVTAPETAEDVLIAAKTLHRGEPGVSGIVMNYGRGTPVAHTFVLTIADFGQPIIDLQKLGDDFDASEIKAEHFRPMIDTPVGRQAADYLLALGDHAHPASLQCDWDRRIGLFAKGEAAMTYGWSVRAAAFELDRNA